jgi:iron(II)-dependent oxidoreductase
MPFKEVAAGQFLMGSESGQEDERPVHRVQVDTFELATYPSPAAMRALPRRNRARHAQGLGDPAFAGDDRPVVGVSWNDAIAYCGGERARAIPSGCRRKRSGSGRLAGTSTARHFRVGTTCRRGFPRGDADRCLAPGP